ncbi:hypothetical protein C9374_008591 [Naegleria lovaniensis]|uniref:Wntless-like transmembrane domain-containing protein n=1 Tax=Naegleria lovaniensis TaxID=51637 RepID=A0AA88KKM4_NAELO|nr:uncharacterized protein C9374_008591 [Naegleria lovaniensis]KAG2377969.1 hypothetical protein C9374_008591 [Naegleria lovaniensis]
MGLREIIVRLCKSEDRSRTYKPLIDILPWWAVLILFIVATVLFIIAILVGVFAGPKVLHFTTIEVDTNNNTASTPFWGLVSDIKDMRSVFYGQEPIYIETLENYTALNQEITFNCYLKSNVSIQNAKSPQDSFGFQKLDLTFYLQLFGRNSYSEEWTRIVNGTYTRSLICTEVSEKCVAIALFYESHIRYTNYRVGLSFLNAKELYDNGLINSGYIGFETESYNYAYANWELGWRYSMICITAPLTVAFIVANIVRSYFVNWTTEQKWIGLLLCFLTLYNNPIFALIFTGGNWAFSFINIIFIVSFLCVLMFTVLVFTHSLVVAQKDRSFLWFYLPKIVLVSILFVFVITTFTYVRLQEQEDPGYSLNIVQGLTSYQTLGIIVVLLMILYIFVLVYYLMRVIEKHRMNLLPKRNAWRGKVIWFLTTIMVIGTIVEIFLYVFSKDWNSAAQFLSYFMFYSLYVWLFTILYWPSWVALQESEIIEETTTYEKEDDYFDDME